MQKQINIGANIRKERLKSSMTQEELAELSNLSTTYISRIERSTHVNIGTDALIAIANALGTNPGVFFLDSDETVLNPKEIPVETRKLLAYISDLDFEKSANISKHLLLIIKELNTK